MTTNTLASHFKWKSEKIGNVPFGSIIRFNNSVFVYLGGGKALITINNGWNYTLIPPSTPDIVDVLSKDGFSFSILHFGQVAAGMMNE